MFNKEAEQEGSAVAPAELQKRLLAKLQLHHRLKRPSEQVRHAVLGWWQRRWWWARLRQCLAAGCCLGVAAACARCLQ